MHIMDAGEKKKSLHCLKNWFLIESVTQLSYSTETELQVKLFVLDLLLPMFSIGMNIFGFIVFSN